MYYQSKVLSKDQAPTTCTILEAKSETYIVEYTDNGEVKTKEISPEELQKLDYSELDISQ